MAGRRHECTSAGRPNRGDGVRQRAGATGGPPRVGISYGCPRGSYVAASSGLHAARNGARPVAGTLWSLPPSKGQAMRVALFITCFNDTLFPEVGISLVRLLERLGIEVDFPLEQTCCGQMHFNTGYQRESIPLARHFVHSFADAGVIVAPSASCVGMVRELYPRVAALSGDAAPPPSRLSSAGACRTCAPAQALRSPPPPESRLPPRRCLPARQ